MLHSAAKLSLYLNKSNQKTLLVANDLIRPALYGATHMMLPSIKSNVRAKKTYEIVGPICESTDKFSTLKNFQELKENDLIVICDVGAYGMSLSSNYNF